MPTIEVSDAELVAVLHALRTYIHVRIGNVDHALDIINNSNLGRAPLTVDQVIALRRQCDDLHEGLTGSRYGGPSIFNKKVSNHARLAYRVLSRINGDTLGESMVDAEGNPT